MDLHLGQATEHLVRVLPGDFLGFIQGFAFGKGLSYGHAVHSQGTGFIDAQNRGGAHSLNSGSAAGQNMFLGDAPGAQGQEDG